jgi:transcription elongation GreA/GreB family factor
MMREQEATRRRADQAEEGRDGERARADALRERLDAIQVQLAARQEVVAAAEAIREANDRRLALGRWARLRRAWRGV